MNSLKRLVCRCVAVAVASVLVSGGVAWAAGSSLQLSIQPGKPEYQKGESILIGFVLQNNGKSPLVLFHPDTLYEAWMGWEISCTVTCPNGQKVRLEPSIQTARGRIPQKENFRELLIGGMIVTTLTVSLCANPNPDDRWVGYVRIPKDREAWPEKALRRKYGLRGDYGFMSNGEETYISLNDLDLDVFSQPGRYSLECRYVNPHSQIFDEHQKLLPVSAWTGTLTATSSLVILP